MRSHPSSAAHALAAHAPLPCKLRARSIFYLGSAAAVIWYAMKTALISLLLLVLVAAACAAEEPHYVEGEDVEIITNENFDALVDNSTDVWLLEYYAPWCGHCKQLAPTYKKVAASLKGKVRVGAIECDANPELAKRAGITGFPSLKIYPSERTFNPYTGVTAKQPIDVNSRDLKTIVAAALKAIPMLIANVTDANFDAFLLPATLPKVIVVSEKSEPSALIRKLAFEFKNRIRFGQTAPSSNPKAAASFPVSKVPAVLLQSGTGEKIEYTGDQSLAAFREFFEVHALPVGARADRWWAGPSLVTAVDVPGLLSRLEPKKAGAEEDDEEARFEMTASQKEAAKAARTPIVAVWFHGASDDSDVEAWAQGWANSVPFVSVDTSKHSVLDFELPSIPCLRLYKGRDDSDDLEGARSSADVASFILSHLPSLVAVFQVSEIPIMQRSAIAAPIAVLYSAKTDIPDLWKRLALQYRGRLSLGIVNQPPPQLLQQYNFKKLPQIMVLFSGNGTAEGLQGAFFQGQFQFEQISTYLKNFVVSEAPKRQAAPAAAVLSEINHERSLARACGDMGLCAIAVLDGLLGADKVKEHVAIMDAVRAKVGGGSAYKFAHVDGVCHSDFAVKFGLNSLPTVVVISQTKKKFVNLVGMFDDKSIASFLDGVLSGKHGTSSFQDLPQLNKRACGEVIAEIQATMAPQSSADEVPLLPPRATPPLTRYQDDVMAEIKAAAAAEEAERKKREKEAAAAAKEAKKKKKSK